MGKRDYYEILELSKNASQEEIKTAFRKLAHKHHPDKSGEESKFKEINEAYEVIGSPDNRTKYDQLGSNYHRYQQMGGNAADFDFSQWFSQGGARGQQVNMDFGDLFGNLQFFMGRNFFKSMVFQ